MKLRFVNIFVMVMVVLLILLGSGKDDRASPEFEVGENIEGFEE